MSNYIVSARKYRPQRFSEVVGQEQVTTTLRNALKTDQLAQAFLFTGPRGVGKTTCARILAKVINCENPVDNFDACGSEEEGEGFYIFELDAASNNSVDDIRALIEQVRFVPPAGKKKIYIIDEVHMLSTNAFNAFLKTLEEPPPYAIFILATTEKHKILPTILSRCQIYDFNRISDSAIVEHLKGIAAQEKIEADDNALHIIALKADGALRDALSIFDMMANFGNGKITYEDTLKNLNVLDYDVYFRMTESMLSADTASILNTFNEVSGRGLAGDHFINGLAAHFRNLLVSQHPDTIKLLESSEDFKAKYANQARVISGDWLLSALNICNSSDIHFKAAKNKRLHIEMALLKLCHINNILTGNIQNTPPIAPAKKKQITQDSTSPVIPIIPEVQKADESVKKDVKKAENEYEKDSASIIDHNIQSENVPAKVEAVTVVKDSREDKTEDNREDKAEAEPAPVEASQLESAPAAETNSAPKLKKKITTEPDLVIPSSLEEHQKASVATQKKKEKLSEAFNSDDLDKVWDDFINSYEEKGGENIVVNLLRESKRELIEADVRLNVAYAFDVDKLAPVRVDLLSFLQDTLKNDEIKLTVHVDETMAAKGEKTAFTSKEKYDAMVQKNPTLKKLKDKLNLELDY